MTIDDRVRELGLVLPEPFRSPTGAAYPFSWVQVRGNRAYVSGHLPLHKVKSMMYSCLSDHNQYSAVAADQRRRSISEAQYHYMGMSQHSRKW